MFYERVLRFRFRFRFRLLSFYPSRVGEQKNKKTG